MFSLVMLAALTSATETPGFHPKQYPYGWPCLANMPCKDCFHIPYWYTGTHTFYQGYYSEFGMSQFAYPYVPGGYGGYGEMPGGCNSGCGSCEPGYKGMPASSKAMNTSNGFSKEVTAMRPLKEKPAVFDSELVLQIPENAVLFVNGVKMKTGSGLRTFRTPQLPVDQKHFYDLKLETVKDGKVTVSEKTIEVKPGKMELAGVFTPAKDLAKADR